MRIGFRDTALIGAVFVVGGSLLTVLLGERSSVWGVAGSMFVTGIGMGLSSAPTVVAIQSVVGWDRRGVVTGTNMFCRAIGSALGAAVFGAVANATLAARFAEAPAALRGQLPDDVDGTARALETPGAVADYARAALHAASHEVFVATAVTALAVALAVALLPRTVRPLEFDQL